MYKESIFIIRTIKVKVSLCLNEQHAMKTYWGSGGIAPRLLDLGTRGEYTYHKHTKYITAANFKIPSPVFPKMS
jgi:hypothetical protein